MYADKNIKKVCSFCVSDLHLITMLLPYLDKKINQKEKLITIFENNLTEQVKLVLSRLTLKEKNKNNLLNINWNSKSISNYEILQEEIYKIFNKKNKLTIIVNGSKEYIENINNSLNKIFNNSQVYDLVKVINCYDITKLDDDIKDILKTHDMILNTSGEKEISEVFEGYSGRLAAM